MGTIEERAGEPAAAEALPAPIDASDDELVARFRSGHDVAFAALVDRHGAALYRFLLAMVRDEASAEEIAQAALVKAAIRIDQLGDGHAFLAWLLSIARTSALDHLRARRPDRHRPLDEAPDAADPAARGLALDIRGTLARMSEDDREVLLLADLMQLSMEELATMLVIGVSAAKMRVKRARARFREIYGAPTDA